MTQTAPSVQQSQKFTLPSGATLAVTVAPFMDSWALMKATLKTMKGMNLTPEDLKAEDLAQFKLGKLSPAILMLALDRVVDFATSPEVEAAMWKCAQKALYIPVASPVEFPGIKVSPSVLFDDAEHGNTAREDFAKIQAILLEVNCRPFLAKALSGFLKAKATSPEGQPSKSA